MAKGAIRIDWFPGDALAGMRNLTPWEELAYRRILDLIYADGGSLVDDDKLMAEQTRTGRKWASVKAGLLDKGKIAIEDGLITNKRATDILVGVVKKIEGAQKGGRESGRVRREIIASRKTHFRAKREAEVVENKEIDVNGGSSDVRTQDEQPFAPGSNETSTDDELSQVVKEEVPKGTSSVNSYGVYDLPPEIAAINRTLPGGAIH